MSQMSAITSKKEISQISPFYNQTLKISLAKGLKGFQSLKGSNDQLFIKTVKFNI